jgi:putative oxidoreductase
MYWAIRGPLAVLGRILVSAIFLMAAVGNKIPHFSQVASYMEAHKVPAPELMLIGAIVFLVVGSLSVIVGYKAPFGALLLLIFLILASYYFHPFWKLEGEAQQREMIHFMKNLSMMGAMLFIRANGAGPMSVDAYLARRGRPAQATASVEA